MKVVVVGTTFVDIKGFPRDSFIIHGRNVGTIHYVHGGVGRNVAEDVVHFGDEAVLLSLVDKTGTSTDVMTHLKEEGVRTEYMSATDDGLGTWMAVFDENGEIVAAIAKRAVLDPMIGTMELCGDEIFRNVDAVLLEIDVPEQITVKTLELAEKYGLAVYGVHSDIRVAMERFEYIKRLKCFICNRQEAGLFFRKDTEALSYEELIDFLAQEIREVGLESVVVTMDKDGCVYVSLGEDGQVAEKGWLPAKQVNVVDTTGAGDSFFAACSTALASGKSMKESCEYAIEVASDVIGSNCNVYCGRK